MTLDILAFAAHPDDAELGCGGSLILAADQGLKVSIADLSEAEMSTRGDVATRRLEAADASKHLGLSERENLDLPDTEIGSDPSHRLSIIQHIRKTKPRIVLAPYWEDRHPDHAATGRLVREACFLAGVQKVGEGPPHRPEKIYYYMISHPFDPSLVVDISTVWDRKMVAVKAYESQFNLSTEGPETPISQPGFMQMIEARSIWFGKMIGASYGEPFFMPGPVPMRQLPGAAEAGQLPNAAPLYNMY
jgi:bacillithiol biosynthesis deacetylase BshB1